MEETPTSKYKRVDFSVNTNNKLLCNVFVMITPQHKSFLLSETYDIRILGQHLCYAKVIKTQVTLLRDIMEHGLFLLDSGLSNATSYLEYIQSQYSHKTWWNGENTAFQVAYFEKIQQLSIFEDGLYPVNT
jgi:hypothetical protein